VDACGNKVRFCRRRRRRLLLHFSRPLYRRLVDSVRFCRRRRLLLLPRYRRPFAAASVCSCHRLSPSPSSSSSSSVSTIFCYRFCSFLSLSSSLFVTFFIVVGIVDVLLPIVSVIDFFFVIGIVVVRSSGRMVSLFRYEG